MKRKLLLYYFLTGITLNLGHPVTIKYVRELGLRDVMFGYFFASMAFGLLIGGIIWGVIADKRLKKPFIAMGLTGYGISQLLFGTLTNPILLLLVRFMAGFFISAASTLVLTLISDYFKPEDRPKIMTYTIALGTIGSTFGYKIGGKIGLFYTREVFFLQLLVNVLMALFVVFFFKEVSTSSKRGNVLKNFLFIREVPKEVVLFLVALSIITIGQINVTKFLEVFLIDRGFDTSQLGDFMIVTGVVSVLTNFLLVPFLAKRFKPLPIMIGSLLLAVVSIFVTVEADDLILAVYTVFMLFYVSRQVFQPFEQSFLANHFESHHSIIMGLRQSFVAVGLVLGPLLGGVLYDLNVYYLFYGSIILLLIGMVMVFVISRHLQT